MACVGSLLLAEKEQYWTVHGQKQWQQVRRANRHEGPSTQKLSLTVETLSLTVSPRGAKAQEYVKTKWDVLHWNEPSENFGPLTHYHSVNKREPVTVLQTPSAASVVVFKYVLQREGGGAKSYRLLYPSESSVVIKIAHLEDRRHIHIPNVTRTHAHAQNTHIHVYNICKLLHFRYNLCPVRGAS